MVIFEVVTSKFPIATIRSEREIIEELNENINFYDDYDFKDCPSNFMEAFILICHEFSSVEDNSIIIKGYGLTWCGYKKYIDNIFPDIFNVINSLRMNLPAQLVFYDIGSEIIIKFRLNVEDPTGTTIYSECVSLRSNESIGVIEIISKEDLIKSLVDLIDGLMLFCKLSYPLVYKNFLHPYLKLHNFAVMER